MLELYYWSIFDLKKAFDIVDPNIMFGKHEYYGIRGFAKDWFSSYLEK